MPNFAKAPPLRPLEERSTSRRCVARFEVRHTQYLDQDGYPLGTLPAVAHDADRLIDLYRYMLLTRTFDSRAVALQRTGQLGTYPSSLGQEATAVGIGAAMAPADVLLGTYRETGAMLVRGVRMSDILLYWAGDERGMAFAAEDAPKQDFPLCVPIASHAPHAVGAAYAFKLRREPRVAVCVLGDGGTSKGDFYEALNAAGVWQVPVVFVIANNGWAISVPRSTQSHAQTLAQKAIAAGIEGEQVDGNDPIAVYDVLSHALAAARGGAGPQLIEAITYRGSDHTTADDARRYRAAEEVEHQRRLDPIARLRAYMLRAGYWGEREDERLLAEQRARVEAAVEEYRAVPPPRRTAMFDYLFAELPEALRAQQDALRAGDAP